MQKDLQGSPLLPLLSGLISINNTFILLSQLEMKYQLMMKSYLLNLMETLYHHPLMPSWPLPVWLGGRYMNIIKPGYTVCVPTKAKYWTFSHLYLVTCTSRYLLYHMYLTICYLCMSLVAFLIANLAHSQMFISLNKQASRNLKN
jgi:hypothetical protein